MKSSNNRWSADARSVEEKLSSQGSECVKTRLEVEVWKKHVFY